jgi:hypothetical protein
MLYCYIEDRQVVKGPCSLPKAWKNVTGFHLLSAEQLTNYGWIPYREVDVHQEGQVRIDEVIEVTEKEVIKTFVYRNMTQSELDDIENNKWNIVRGVRNDLLKQSDWTQLADSPLEGGTKLAWAQYRQALRDITAQPDPSNVVWPQSPDSGISTVVL